MSRTWLLLDTNYLAWRSFHVFGGLKFGDARTGVIFGLLKEIGTLMDQHATRNVVFCFDNGPSLREQVYPNYKGERRKRLLTPEETEAYADMRAQVKVLRDSFLPDLGFKNIFHQEGYEADDVIASVVNHLTVRRKQDEVVIVSADKDLYQLLGTRVLVWNPQYKTFFTQRDLAEKFWVAPEAWHEIKAIAGCSTDSVPGVKGVGEVTAGKFLNGTLNPKAKCLPAIRNWVESQQYKDNLILTKLPYPGVTKFVPTFDKIDRKAWERLTKKFGMHSLKDKVPGVTDRFFSSSTIRRK